MLIHGITPTEHPGSHSPQYDALFSNIQSALDANQKPKFRVNPIKIEWGWYDPSSTQPMAMDQHLAEVERLVARHVLEVESNVWDFTINPARWAHKIMRRIFLFGFADLIYYASRDGEETVRQHVFQDIVEGVSQHIHSDQDRISLTIIGHSAGSLIAHDLLYHLFGQGKVSEFPLVRDLRKLADQTPPRLRVRRFYTIGSPITPLTFRSNKLIEKNLNRSPLRPSDLGLQSGQGLTNPRWVNIWDIDDIASFPLGFLYTDADGTVKDQYIEMGDVFPLSHDAYWKSNKVAKMIAQTF